MDRKREVQGALVAAGSNYSEVARELDLSIGTVSRILSGKYPLRSVLSQRTRDLVLGHVSAKTGIDIAKLRELTTAEQAA